MDSIKSDFLQGMERIIGQIVRLSMRSFRQYIKNQGLTMPQMMALQRIHFKDHCNVAEISDELGVTDAATSQLIDRLVQQGLVERSENPQDRRNKILALTDLGLSVVENSLLARKRWLIAIAEVMSEDELRTVSLAMDILIQKTAQFEEDQSLFS